MTKTEMFGGVLFLFGAIALLFGLFLLPSPWNWVAIGALLVVAGLRLV